MSDFREGIPANDEDYQQGPEGLLFTGDAIRALSAEQLTTIGDVANRMFGVEMRPVQSVERDLESAGLAVEEHETVDPMPATKGDFRQFAADHGYSDARGCKSWNSIFYTDIGLRDYRNIEPVYVAGVEVQWRKLLGEVRTFPGMHWINTDLETADSCSGIVDINSVYDYLVRTKQAPGAWIRGNKAHVKFLTHIVNELVQPDEPLPLD